VSRLLGVVLVLGSVTAMAGPRGRVIRVERAEGGAAVAPRLCDVRGDTGTCVGEEPQPGQTVLVFDERHVVAEVQIVEAATLMASCANVWTVKTRALRGVTVDGEGIGVIDPGVNPGRARVLDKHHLPASPSGLPGDEVWRGIDRDGDGAADILVTRYSCTPSGAPLPGGATYCIDVWARAGARMIRTTQLNFAQCST
jgi:hypothetical protein